jgi:glycosyltransferase involved in cell wall biosynthesis
VTPHVLANILAYNEEGSIDKVLMGLRRSAPHFDLVVVNDGSKDATGDTVTKLGEKQWKCPSAPRICILTETYYPVVGGGETQARALADSLVDEDLFVMVLTRRSDAAFEKVERLGQVIVHRLPPVGDEHYRKWGLLFSSLPALIKHRRRYDLIFVSGFRVLGIVAVLVSQLFGKTCVLKADSLGEMAGGFFGDGLARYGLKVGSFPFRAFLRVRNWILRRAHYFVAISSEIAAELRACGVNPRKIQLIPNGVDTTRFHPVSAVEKQELRRQLDLPKRDTIVTYTGRLVSYKGLPLLLRVWQDIQHQYAYVTLLLVGSGSQDIHNCEAELQEYVAIHNLQNSVTFVGNVENVQEYLQASDVFVFPTECEAFGIALVEAMACSLPAISTSVGGVRDILQHLLNGLVIQPGSFQQLYDALALLITDGALSANLGRAARQTAQDRYTMVKISRQYVRLLKSLSDLQGTVSAPDTYQDA